MKPFAIAAALSLTLLLGACGEEAADPDRGTDPGAEPTSAQTAGAMPTAIPAADGPVRTSGLVAVLDAGEGPMMCDGLLDSYPPQCSGPALIDWSWGDVGVEKANGTTWGSFALTGTWDGTALTVTDSIPAALYDAVAPEHEPLGTPCEAPAGGWKLVDKSKVSPEAMDAAFQAASALPDYASAWMDQALGGEEPTEATGNDPRRIILNVAVTGDTAAAEAELRKVWGGKLCISSAEHTERELTSIQTELNKVPGMLSTGSSALDRMDLLVVHDDGSIQAWADATYGEGLVEVTSLLVPVDA